MKTTEAIDKFIANQSVMVATGQISKATLQFYVHQLKHLRRAAADIQVDQLTIEHLVDIKLTNHTVRAMKRLTSWLVDEGRLPKDPFRKLTVPKTGQRNRVVTHLELVRLYRSSPKSLRRVLFSLLHSCARPQELRTWRWGDVDLESRVVRLKKFKSSEQRRDGVRVRVIPLDAPLTAWLKRRLAKLAKQGNPPTETDYVYLDSKGKPWTSNGLRCAMRRARSRAGLGADANGERLVCYSLRHTGATKLAKSGVRDSALAEIMGHTKTEMTRRYIHRDGSDLVKLIDAANQSRQ